MRPIFTQHFKHIVNMVNFFPILLIIYSIFLGKKLKKSNSVFKMILKKMMWVKRTRWVSSILSIKPSLHNCSCYYIFPNYYNERELTMKANDPLVVLNTDTETIEHFSKYFSVVSVCEHNVNILVWQQLDHVWILSQSCEVFWLFYPGVT